MNVYKMSKQHFQYSGLVGVVQSLLMRHELLPQINFVLQTIY